MIQPERNIRTNSARGLSLWAARLRGIVERINLFCAWRLRDQGRDDDECGKMFATLAQRNATFSSARDIVELLAGLPGVK